MPRDHRPRLTDRDLVHALQRLRLEGLETGRFEPLSDRESFYLQLFRAGLRPDREDFILSPALLRLEAVQFRSGGEEEPEAALPFTASPEPAISRP
ncbi:hypothetical protein [Brevundimonas sp. LjRoot202]|uniref:hypothetical protein n=1 Tax=Brevundimonas sp. LjRoot202 TaxID=3342281 RepID=UPI003ECEEA82